ncbi:hypothetical protein MRX96_047209 [Rhipicephalus microplus]
MTDTKRAAKSNHGGFNVPHKWPPNVPLSEVSSNELMFQAGTEKNNPRKGKRGVNGARKQRRLNGCTRAGRRLLCDTSMPPVALESPSKRGTLPASLVGWGSSRRQRPSKRCGEMTWSRVSAPSEDGAKAAD